MLLLAENTILNNDFFIIKGKTFSWITADLSLKHDHPDSELIDKVASGLYKLRVDNSINNTINDTLGQSSLMANSEGEKKKSWGAEALVSLIKVTTCPTQCPKNV